MIGRFFVRTFGKIVGWPIRRRMWAFYRALPNPERVQWELLQSILRLNERTAFARDHGFSTIRSIADYRRQVPHGGYEQLAPYIERVKAGEVEALLGEGRVLLFALTSGTTAQRKLIPITPRYLKDYRRGWNIWGIKAMRDHRPIILRPILQLVGDPEEYRTAIGVPCGNLSGYTAQVQKRYIQRLYSVPAITGKLHDPLSRYYVALLRSLDRPLGMILAANPSTLVALGKTLASESESLLRDLHDGTLRPDLPIPETIRAALQRLLPRNPRRAKDLDRLRSRHGGLRPVDIWPAERTLLGTWTGGSVGAYLKLLPQFYGATPIRDLGLLASEGRMTIPVEDHTPGGILDITSHYFEFIPESEIDSAQPIVLGAHELEAGRNYFILPTTAAGLYRYHIIDLVRVRDFAERTPIVEFVGKGNRFANLTGEKLSEYQVTQAVTHALAQSALRLTAYAIAPCWDDEQPFYAAFLEAGDCSNDPAVQVFLKLVDAHLMAGNMEYAAKRASRRLGPLRAVIVPTGFWHTFDRERLAKTGGSAEQYKRPALINDPAFRTGVAVEREIRLP